MRSPIPQDDGVDVLVPDREAVGVGQGQLLAGDADPVGGVPGGVDDAQPDPVPGLGLQGVRIVRSAPVEEVHGVGDVPGVPAEEVAGGTHEHVAHLHGAIATTVVHPAHCPHVAHPLGVFLQDVLGGGTGPVDPVVQDDGPVLVVLQGFLGVLDDQGTMEGAFALQLHVGVVPGRCPGGGG